MSEDIPLPKINQRYRDDHGALVTVTSVEETRVVFMRDGYPHPCMRPMCHERCNSDPHPTPEIRSRG
ncbi:DUF4222 domain-containing protein [Escherichia coli]|uniref:DUF4222 domain-containing protein n=1 Tax=Escherichia coli TaxID=562 RepID=UPI000A2DAA8E|nr:DUF4222 domain-containing protein [Escherichia coli]OTB94608.1 hypothetical protein AW066_20805 [Escherichia coli]OTE47060.1 hypothetical protein AW115_22180 [Escherichia coli]TJQ07322.1 DUF4222 domain-containing protein [Escherichia coli]